MKDFSEGHSMAQPSKPGPTEGTQSFSWLAVIAKHGLRPRGLTAWKHLVYYGRFSRGRTEACLKMIIIKTW